MIARSRKRRRSKIRKPRFLSLRRELSRPRTSDPVATQMTTDGNRDYGEQNMFEQLDLFPLHPELMVEGKDADEEEEEEEDAGDTPRNSFFYPELGVHATLTSLLGATTHADVNATSAVEEEERRMKCMPSSTSPPPPPAASIKHHRLARAALRGRERWPFCQNDDGDRRGILCLKLDYEQVLNAWSEKGSLYIHDDNGDGESQMIVPQLLHQHHPLSSEQTCCYNHKTSSLLWTAPENGCGDGVLEMSRRKERVMRYKEKRELRLFSKRIRYQVRKLNAEKRPRIKGRFVKRVDPV